MLTFSPGCMNYYKVTRPENPGKSTMDGYIEKDKIFFLITGEGVFRLKQVLIRQDVMTAFAEPQPDYTYHLTTKPEGANRYRQKTDGSQAKLLKHVLLYVPDFIQGSGDLAHVPLESVEKVELYDEHTGATIASWAVGVGLVVAASALLLPLLAMAIKGSCPFIYTYDGQDFAFTGEVFSGSTLPQLERHDYLKLPLADASADAYRLIIANEVREIQHTNLVELLVLDHPAGVEIHADKKGRIHSLADIQPPVSAVNLAGTDLLAMVSDRDDIAYVGLDPGRPGVLTDGLILEFTDPKEAAEARLVIRAKNSFLLDFHMGRFHDLFGRSYARWHQRQLKTPEAELRQWITDQHIPLSVFVENDGRWEYVDHFNVAGPMAMREDVLSIPLGQVQGKPLRVKLEYGKYFWEVDFVGIDYLPDAPTLSQVVQATSARDHAGADIGGLIAGDDDLYYVQPEIGDEAILNFNLPPQSGEARSLILHSKGHYHILREPAGRPQVRSLKAFRQPGHFNRFTNEFMESGQTSSATALVEE